MLLFNTMSRRVHRRDFFYVIVRSRRQAVPRNDILSRRLNLPYAAAGDRIESPEVWDLPLPREWAWLLRFFLLFSSSHLLPIFRGEVQIMYQRLSLLCHCEEPPKGGDVAIS